MSIIPDQCLYFCAEAKQDLMTYVGFVQDLVSDPESSLTGEEKVTHFPLGFSNICLYGLLLIIALGPFCGCAYFHEGPIGPGAVKRRSEGENDVCTRPPAGLSCHINISDFLLG